MTTLAEVRERDAKYTVLDMKWSGTPEATKDRRFLLSQLDALQAECEGLKLKNAQLIVLERQAEMENARLSTALTELSALKLAIREAGPAIEAGAEAIEYFTNRATMVSAEQADSVAKQERHAKQLRALLDLP